MGCSPSKGRHNLSGSQGPFRKGRTLLPGSRESIGESQMDNGASGGSSSSGGTDGEGGVREKRSGVQPILSQEDTHGRRPSLAAVAPKGAYPDKLDTHEIEIDMIPQGMDTQGDVLGKRGVRKPKKNKESKLARKKNKDKKAPVVELKVEFPEPLVKAHQAAYAFLNPSIAKYEVLLGLLDQAAQTHLSLQPMTTFLALRYEQVNCGLKEMAEEGERLLKESGEHLAWPCPMKNLPATSSKVGDAAEPPPDLLQQLLQYTVQRMQLVGHSVSGIGDSALEETGEYFASLSELLGEKLKTKRVLEARLGQVLARIESAALRKPGPADSALYSEDSGIGAESESLAGSEHQHNRRESCESTSTTCTRTSSPSVGGSTPTRRGAPRRRLTGKMSSSVSLTSLDSTCTITAKESRDTESLLGSASLDDGEGEEEEDEEDEDDNEEVDKQMSRKRSDSSPPDPCQLPRRLPPKRIENPQNVEMTLKMKDAISGRIRFFRSQQAGGRANKQAGGSPVKSGPQWTEQEGEQQAKRPQMAAPSTRGLRKKPSVAKERRSRSAESLRSRAEDPTLLELERTQKDLSQRLERMGKLESAGEVAQGPGPKRGEGKQPQTAHSPAAGHLSSSLDRNSAVRPGRDKAALRRHSSGEHGTASEDDEKKKKKEKKAGKGPLRATPPPGTPPSSPHQPSGLLRGRNSVKRLIDTFSQGLDEKRSQRTSKLLAPLRAVRKCGVPVMPGLGGAEETPDNSPNSSSCRAEDLDLDSLPPPPLEVLMDTSFESAQGSVTSDSRDDVFARRGRSVLPQRMTVTQRLRASMQPVTVLPSRSNLRRRLVSVSPARPACHDLAQPEVDPETEEAATLYKQARKIIHLQHSAEPPPNKPQADSGPRKSTPTKTRAGGRKGGSGPSDTVPSTPYINSQPPATPPNSRARMLPSTPSNTSSQHRRLPSPPASKCQPTPPSATSPPVNRNLPATPPSGHRKLPSPIEARKSVTPPSTQWKAPSPPALSREGTPNSSVGSYPFKAPSPPASPRVQRRTRENSSEEIVSLASPAVTRGFNNAHSVFCPASPNLFEAQPCLQPQPPQAWASTSGCVLPRPWGDSARGRLPTSVRGPRQFVRRCHSDHRPSLTLPPQKPAVSVAHSCGSEPSISTQGLEDGPTREEEPWGSQLDLRAANRSASHPDLCIVGHALQRE